VSERDRSRDKNQALRERKGEREGERGVGEGGEEREFLSLSQHASVDATYECVSHPPNDRLTEIQRQFVDTKS